MLATRFLTAMCVGVLVGVLVAPVASATTYTVTATQYSATNDVSITDLWDSYELTASVGQSIEYSVSASGGGCVLLLFIRGHSVTINSQYYSAYSQVNCVPSYSNRFPVASSDGTDFSVLIATTSSTSVTYTVNINVVDPGLGGALLGLFIIFIPIIVIVIVVVLALLRRRKKATPMPPYAAPWPTQPQTMPPPPVTPPEQPPQPPMTPP